MINKTLLIILAGGLFFFIYGTPFAHSQSAKEVFEQGVFAFNSHDYKKAIILFEKIVQVYPLAQAYNYLALAKRAEGAPLNEVVALFKKAIELKPDYAEAYENIGKTYYSLEKFAEAEEYIGKSLEFNPNSVSARLSLAWIQLLGFSKGAEAIPNFEFAIQYTDIPYTYFGLGMAYILAGEKFKALEMITYLRQRGEENMAGQLEKMVAEGGQGTFLRPPQQVALPEAGSSTLISGPRVDDIATPDNSYRNMKVRLSDSPIQPSGSPTNSPYNSVSGEERLKQLQQQDYFNNN